MAEGDKVDIQNATQNLGEQTQRINIALKYTEGNMDQARKMVAGDLKDVYVLKMKLKSDLSREFGIFLIFMSKLHGRLKNIQVGMSRSPYVFDKKTSLVWKEFNKEMEAFRADKDHDPILSNQMINALKKRMQGPLITTLVQSIDARNISEVTETMTKIFHGEMQMTKALVQVDFEVTNSLALHDNGIEDMYSSPSAVAKDSAKEEELSPEMQKLLVDALQGASVLSPTRGKDLGKLQLGDKIKVHITDTSERGRNIIKILSAETEEGSLKAVPARIRFIKKMGNGKWLIIGDLGENIFVRIEEETDNVRVALVDIPSAQDVVKNNAKNSSYLPMMIAVGLGVFVLILTIVIFLFL